MTAQRVAADNVPFGMCTVPIHSLQRALYAATKKYFPLIIDVRFGVSNVTVNEDGTVSWAESDNISQQSLRPTIAVLACGAHSNIVQPLLPTPTIHSPTQHFIYYPLPANSTSTIGRNIYFHRHFDHTSHTFIKQAIVGHATSAPVASIQLTAPPSPDSPADNHMPMIEQAMARFQSVFPSLQAADLKPSQTAPTHFTVTETSLNSFNAGPIIALGDAARTGHFNSALGVTLALVCDVNAMGRLVEGVTKFVGDRRGSVDTEEWFSSAHGAELLLRFNHDLQETSRVFREKDLAWFYERL
ncbi:hypothetical protein HK097_006102 [Rhizophlyctis rosea]|uniref:Uncharacterized protein n=1 Tax=Rhizophlyctis rosea TaxID=64517 RepID=A0AAD5SKV1_9FUNG|nr:hypothetical protein HK097_006102 [Rhizophlyctis rosea]